MSYGGSANVRTKYVQNKMFGNSIRMVTGYRFLWPKAAVVAVPLSDGINPRGGGREGGDSEVGGAFNES